MVNSGVCVLESDERMSRWLSGDCLIMAAYLSDQVVYGTAVQPRFHWLKGSVEELCQQRLLRM